MELISAYADGELSDSDKLLVENHISECESCSVLLDIYREISASIIETSADAPDALRIGVMNRVLYEDIPNVIENKKQRGRFHFALTRFAPIAACLVVGVLIWQNWGTFFGDGRFGGHHTDFAPAAAPMVPEEAPAPASEAEQEIDVHIERGIFPDEAAGELFDDADASDQVEFAPTDATDDLMINDENRSPEETERIGDYISNAYAEISITGELPDFLAGYEPQSFGSWFGWECVYEIPRSSVPDFLSELGNREGVLVSYSENDSLYAVVMYSP